VTHDPIQVLLRQKGDITMGWLCRMVGQNSNKMLHSLGCESSSKADGSERVCLLSRLLTFIWFYQNREVRLTC